MCLNMCDDEAEVYLFYNKCTYPIGEYYIEIQMLIQSQIYDILVIITEYLPHISQNPSDIQN